VTPRLAAAVAAACVAALLLAVAGAAASGGRTAGVSVYFPRGDPGSSCTRVFAVRRAVATPAVLKGALQALLRGPTAAERRRGFGGWFSARTAGRLRGVRIANGVAHVDFRNFRRIVPNASTSCGSALLLAQLDRTVLQFPTVRRSIYSFDGRRAAFYEWLQRTPPS
jgi:spore germination protein GerM